MYFNSPYNRAYCDVLVWSDDQWCYRYELNHIPELSELSDDYQVIPYLSENYNSFLSTKGH